LQLVLWFLGRPSVVIGLVRLAAWGGPGSFQLALPLSALPFGTRTAFSKRGGKTAELVSGLSPRGGSR